MIVRGVTAHSKVQVLGWQGFHCTILHYDG